MLICDFSDFWVWISTSVFKMLCSFPPELVFIPHFLKTGRGYGLMTATCHLTVVGGKQGYTLCKILFVSVEFC